MIKLPSNDDLKDLKDLHSDKEIKKAFKVIASNNPDKYFPTEQLRKLGYIRKECISCGTFFWTQIMDRIVCGDPVCSGGFKVTERNPAKLKLSYIGVWEKMVEVLEPRGYVPIKRYPCVARWNPTSEFTIASISAFQPYVITGEVDPPAKKLIIPQFCLRFNDIENVGLTGAHLCGFTMIGQHFFGSPEEWNQGELFQDIHDFIHIGVGLPKEEITIHEDSWAGGGSFGCSLEFFSRGVELFNQVYTMYEQTIEGPKELNLKVLDMGMGQERVAWFSQGTLNIYEATFPYVISKLREITNIELDLELYDEFSVYSAYLNNDEVESMDNAWKKVANKLELDVSELRLKILPMTALYSIAEHARTLLFALNDGKLPSNMGGGYNLRVIFRRAISFIDRFKWKIDLADVCRWHAEELKGLFPELSEHLNEIEEILDVEKEKYYENKKKAGKIVERNLKKGHISVETLIELYDSRGINPELVKETAKKCGISIKIPDNFYNLVVEKHELEEKQKEAIKDIELDLNGILETKSLYYYDYRKISNKAEVLKIIEKKVILNQSVAYPTSGGQLHDIGKIENQPFNNVYKQGNHVIHVMEDYPRFKEGDQVFIEVDKNWRYQLSQHHTATHIVNAAAREVLGNHINQAGAKKTLKNSHLDITHYAQIPSDKLNKIEEVSNEIVESGIDINLSFLPRSEAEKRYGMRIYQGGAVPGKMIRIVEVPGVDVEACGGTHLNNTSETGKIKITKSRKVQDGIIRLTFTAGEATKNYEEKQELLLEQLEKKFNVSREYLVGRTKELIKKWKIINKVLENLKFGKIKSEYLELTSEEKFEDDILSKLALLLKTKKEDKIPKDKIPSRIEKFYSEWNEAKRKIKKLQNIFSSDYIEELIDNAEKINGIKLILKYFTNISQEDLNNLSKNIMKHSEDIIAILMSKVKNGTIILGMMGDYPSNKLQLNMGSFIKNISERFNGKGGGSLDYGQGFMKKLDSEDSELINIIRENLNEFI
jgi:alanyl-tRNA synthetase